MTRAYRLVLLLIITWCLNGHSMPLSSISLNINSEKQFGNEGYELTANGDVIVIEARDTIGLARGIQTLRQLLPNEIESSSIVSGQSWTIPEVTIADSARFPWRSAMLDPGRQFLTKDFVLSYIDILALLKMNRIHLHLTDNEGWRLQIDAFPALTEIGAWGQYDGVTEGGFYTKDDIAEIVSYAGLHGIEVVPEIDMPAHSMAAMASIPELMCLGTPQLPVLDRDNKSDHPTFSMYGMCIGHDAAFTALKSIMDEVFEMFPSQYVHLGTDELNTGYAGCTWANCSRCQGRLSTLGLSGLDELFDWFCDTMVSYCESKGKQVVTWGGGTSNSVIKQRWGHEVSQAWDGLDIIQSPQPWTYFDRGPWPGNERSLTSEIAYNWNPIPPEAPANTHGQYLGVGAQLWERGLLNGSAWYAGHSDGSYTAWPLEANGDVVEFWSFPRMGSTAEVGWTPQALRSYSEFAPRLGRFMERLNVMGAKYYDGDLTVADNPSLVTAIVPRPVVESVGSGTLELDESTTITAPPEAASLLAYLATFLSRSTGYTFDGIVARRPMSTPAEFHQPMAVQRIAAQVNSFAVKSRGAWKARIVNLAGATIAVSSGTGPAHIRVPGSGIRLVKIYKRQ